MKNQTPPIAVVRPGSLTPADLQKLRDAGYVVVESATPDAVTVTSGLALPIDPLRVAEAAFIAVGHNSSAALKFGETLQKFLEEAFKKASAEAA